MNNFLIGFVSAGTIISGILVITSINPVISVLFLICVFVNVASYLILIGVGFIGISYIIVYVGAIAILFLFVIMMLNLQIAEVTASGFEFTQSLPLGAILGTILLFEITSIIPFTFKDTVSFDISSVNNIITTSNYTMVNNFNYLFNTWEHIDSTIFNNIKHIFNFNNSEYYFINSLQIQSIANIIYINNNIWLLLTSIILLIAMIGPIVLSLKKLN